MPSPGENLLAPWGIAVERASVHRPLVRLVQTVAQNLTNNTDTAITFDLEDIDTDGFHNSGSSRITPNLPGYYRLEGRVVFSGDNDFTNLQGRIAKNGAVQPPIDRQLNSGTSGSAGRGVYAFGTFAANGTTDYFELMALQQNTSGAATPTNIGGSFASVLECTYVRAL